MKRLGFVLLLASAVAFGQQKKTAWENMKLKGKVKTYRLLDYPIDDDGKPYRGNSEYYVEFNNQGRTTKMETNNSGNISSFEDTYDAQGNLIRSVSKDEDGKTLSTNVYQYDSKGNRILQEVLTARGDLFMQRKYSYNVANKVTERVSCFSGNCDEKTTYTYDNKGFLIQETLYKKEGLSSKIIYKNDAKGNHLEKLTYSPNEVLLSKVETKYDTKNNELEVSVYKQDGTLSEKKTFTYEYDKNQNWIKKTEIRDGVPFMLLEQKIEYFK